MNIRDARERTEVGQRYRREGQLWYITKGHHLGEDVVSDGMIVLPSALAIDWYPDEMLKDAEFMNGALWTAEQIKNMCKPGPIEFKPNYFGDRKAIEDWLQRNTKRIEDLERINANKGEKFEEILKLIKDLEGGLAYIEMQPDGPQVDVKNLLDRVIAVEGWLSKLEIRSGHDSNQLWDIKKSLLRSNGSPPNCHDEHARNQFSMLRKRVQSLESFEKRFEVWSYSLVDKWTENLRKLARGLNKVEAWQNAHSGATAPQERGKGK